MKSVFIVFAHADAERCGSHTMHDTFLSFHWSVQLTPQIRLPSNVLSKPIQYYDKLPLLLSFPTTNQTTITCEMTDGKRERKKNQEQWKDGDKHRNNQEQILAMSQLAYTYLSM